MDPEGRFLHDMRRTHSEEELFTVCRRHLLTKPESAFADEPYDGVIARPQLRSPAGARLQFLNRNRTVGLFQPEHFPALI